MHTVLTDMIYIGSDHAGFSLKTIIAAHLKNQQLLVEDMGAHSQKSCDYPDYAHKVCQGVLQNRVPGILICGTGIGMSMAANKIQGIRAAICTHSFHARASRAHNNANVLCLGERITAPGLAIELVDLFLTTSFEGGRHEHRIALLENITHLDR